MVDCIHLSVVGECAARACHKGPLGYRPSEGYCNHVCLQRQPSDGSAAQQVPFPAFGKQMPRNSGGMVEAKPLPRDQWPEPVTKANQLKPGMKVGDALDVLSSIGGGGMTAAEWKAVTIQLSAAATKPCWGTRINFLSARYPNNK